jgi:immune inhibitor A
VKVRPKHVYLRTLTKLSAAASTDAEDQGHLDFSWDLHDGGTTKDATGPLVRTRFQKPGWRKVTVTVTDPKGLSDVVEKRVLVERIASCLGRAVDATGGWRVVKDAKAPHGDYCDNGGRRQGSDTLTLTIRGPQLDVFHGRAAGGGSAKVLVDGRKVGTVDFSGSGATPRLRYHQVFKHLGAGRHEVVLVVTRGTAYLEGFGSIR